MKDGDIGEDEIKFVMEKANVDHQTALNELKINNSDTIAAITTLSKRQEDARQSSSSAPAISQSDFEIDPEEKLNDLTIDTDDSFLSPCKLFIGLKVTLCNFDDLNMPWSKLNGKIGQIQKKDGYQFLIKINDKDLEYLKFCNQAEKDFWNELSKADFVIAAKKDQIQENVVGNFTLVPNNEEDDDDDMDECDSLFARATDLTGSVVTRDETGTTVTLRSFEGNRILPWDALNGITGTHTHTSCKNNISYTHLARTTYRV